MTRPRVRASFRKISINGKSAPVPEKRILSSKGLLQKEILPSDDPLQKRILLPKGLLLCSPAYGNFSMWLHWQKKLWVFFCPHFLLGHVMPDPVGVRIVFQKPCLR